MLKEKEFVDNSQDFIASFPESFLLVFLFVTSHFFPEYDPVCTVIVFQPKSVTSTGCAEWRRPELTALFKEAVLTCTISQRAVLDLWVTFLAKICEDSGLAHRPWVLLSKRKP